jgi:hypothetical protein
LGGDEGIDAILEKNIRLGCNTCGASPAPYLNPMDEYLRDVAYFAENFSQVDGYTKALKLLKSDGTGNKVEPEAFILRVLRSDGRKQLQGLEVALEGCEPDVILDDGTVCEFKSWSATVPVDDAEEDDAGGIIGTSLCFDRFAKGQGAYGQFKKILQLAEVPTLSLLNYIFDGRKINAVNKEEYVKKQFQRLLYDASANDGKGGLTAMGEEVWGIIDKKDGMKGDLKTLFKEDFIINVSDIKNSFYKFIQIK